MQPLQHNTSILDYVIDNAVPAFPTGKVLNTHLLMVAVQPYLFLRFQHASGSMMAYLITTTIYLHSL